MAEDLEEKMRKVILITGSGKEGRVGNHLAKKFAEDGYDIVIHYNSSKKDALEVVDNIKKKGVDAALNSPYPDYDAYILSKAAVLPMTKLFAKEFAPKVLVNSIAPGPIKPPKDMPKKEIDESAEGTLIKRWIGEEEVYKLAKYLIKTKSRTGQIVNLDGGKYSA